MGGKKGLTAHLRSLPYCLKVQIGLLRKPGTNQHFLEPDFDFRHAKGEPSDKHARRGLMEPAWERGCRARQRGWDECEEAASTGARRRRQMGLSKLGRPHGTGLGSGKVRAGPEPRQTLTARG